MSEILVMTVGGKEAPLLEALSARAWSHVVFVCSTATEGSESSETMAARLAAVAPGTTEVLGVPADDVDAVYAACLRRLHDLTQVDDATVYVNFTGGTKSMSAGLCLAGASRPDVAVELVTGQRRDLVHVRDADMEIQRVHIRHIRLDRALETHLGQWQDFGYAGAARGLADLGREIGSDNPELSARTKRLQNLSQAFDRWDRFEHAAALSVLGSSALKDLDLEAWKTPLALLADRKAWEPIILFDLWAAARRRAAQGRYDDAVARLYRLMEWAASWLVRSRSRTYDPDRPIPRHKLSPAMQDRVKKGDPVYLGLEHMWHLFLEIAPSHPVARFMAESDGHELARMLELKDIRNQSFGAHGRDPVAPRQWEEFADWTEGFMEVLREAIEEMHGPLPEIPEFPRRPSDIPGLAG